MSRDLRLAIKLGVLGGLLFALSVVLVGLLESTLAALGGALTMAGVLLPVRKDEEQ